MPATPLLTPDVIEEVDVDETTDTPWQVLLHNDPVTPMQLVVRALQSVFGYDRVRAEKIMFDAHTDGRAVAADGPRERCEAWAAQLGARSLWASVEKAP